MKPSYDTIHCWLPRGCINTEAHEVAILGKLSNIGESYKENWGLSQFGQLDNLNVSIAEKSVTIKGSLCKYYWGDNLQPLSLSDTNLAIEKLSDLLLLPLKDASISRLDLAANLVLNHPVAHYLPYLGNARHYIRLEQPNTLYYNRGKILHQLVFYDKVEEIKSKREKLSPALKQMNLLRYEMRYLRQIEKQLKASVTLGVLYKPAFYHDMVKRWHKSYLNIVKEREINLGVRGLNLLDDYSLLSELSLMKLYGGQRRLLDAINMEKSMELYTPARRASASRLTKKIKVLGSHPEFTFQSSLIDELDQKITEAVNYALLQ
jgi:hypothetical protein